MLHLLTETAIGDSQRFQILSHEETDSIKQELSILSTRIDGIKRKLVLETKFRDAAQSLNRLQESPDAVESSPKSPKRHRRSTMGSRGSLAEMLNKTDGELADSARKCDDLAQELWGLEKRAESFQKRLLEHTAGVLQKTHKGFLEEAPPSRQDGPNNYYNGRDLYQPLDLTQDFDDSAFFPVLDSFLDSSGAHTFGRPSTVDTVFSRQTQAILATERKLEDLNHRLRESIEQMTTTSHPRPVPPAKGLNNGQELEPILGDQLDFLEEYLSIFQQSHDVASRESKHIAHLTEERLEHLNSQLREIIARNFQGQKSEYLHSPDMAGQGPKVQIDHLESGLDAVRQGIHHLIDDYNSLASQTGVHEGRADQYDAVLKGLWEILLGGEEEDGRGQPIQLDVCSEEFSVQAFSAKIQALFARATSLQEQKDVLTRQVQQQRGLNNKPDSEKGAKISGLLADLEQTQQSLAMKEREANEARKDLVLMTERVDAMRQEASQLQQQRSMNQGRAKEASNEDEEQLYADLDNKQRRITDLENELAESKDDYGISNAEMLGKLKESDKYIENLGSELQKFRDERQRSQSEMRELEGQMVVLQTELTVAKAELDGAYGTRAQRAAEQASNPAKQQEFEELTSRNKSLAGDLEGLNAQHQAAERTNADLNQRMQTLQRELTETIGEYETMTRASIEFEREREQLESNLDALRERCESVESQLSEEKVRWLGMKSPGSTRDSMSPGTTSTQVLKNEFKKMMRDTRAENMRALRVNTLSDRSLAKANSEQYEQEERRKLEALIRTMKREQTPGKSSLSQSMTAS